LPADGHLLPAGSFQRAVSEPFNVKVVVQTDDRLPKISESDPAR